MVSLERAAFVGMRVGAPRFLRKACSSRLVNLAIAALVTVEVSVIVHWDLQFNIHSSSTFYHLLFPNRYHDEHNRRSTSVYHIYSVDEALEVLRFAVQRFYALPGSSVDLYQITGPARMHLTLWDTPPALTDAGKLQWSPVLLPTETYVVEEREPLGPFTNSTQDLFHRLVEMDLELHLVSIAQEAEDFKSFEWEVHLVWDFAHRGGRVDMYLATAALPVHVGQPGEHAAPSHGGDLGTVVWLLLCVLCMASLTSCLAMRRGLGWALRRTLGAVAGEAELPSQAWKPTEASHFTGRRDTQFAGDCRQIEEEAGCDTVPFYLQWPFHRAVRDVAILAFLLLDASQGSHTTGRRGLVSTRRALHWQVQYQEQHRQPGFENWLVWLEVRKGIHLVRLLGGVAVFWAWLCVNESPARSLLSRMMVQAIPPVVSFLITSLPLFLGFASLGVVLFSEHAPAKFGTLGNAAVTLFSLLNGDVLMETMLDIEAAGALISRGYVCAFICVFVFMVLNATLCLIQDSFRIVKAHQVCASN
uniref:Ion transport domain-containing protein n=1 Tax=Alexandrium catenella TaxID=2925 RepID=A0A7S1WR57_ALECA